MRPEVAIIKHQLDIVETERARRVEDPNLGLRVGAVKAYQHQRFEKTYEDLLASPRFGPAARFFLEDLYGPHDFAQRDQQFARVIPSLVRLFPKSIVATVSTLVELHALTEVLDTQMAMSLGTPIADPIAYRQAWQQTGRRADRFRQIELMDKIGRALEGYTRNPLLRHSLRAMRQPAQVAGLGALQTFLETGFDTFRAMGGADEFLSTIVKRERAQAEFLFNENHSPES